MFIKISQRKVPSLQRLGKRQSHNAVTLGCGGTSFHNSAPDLDRHFIGSSTYCSHHYQPRMYEPPTYSTDCPKHSHFRPWNPTQRHNCANSTMISNCHYCKALKPNSAWGSTEIATQIAALSQEHFDDTHRQFANRGFKYVLPAGGCVQFLLATMEDRLASVTKYSDICPICLAVPRVKMPNGQCKGKHVIEKRQDGKFNSLCKHQECNLHHLICKSHRELNKDHPHHYPQSKAIQELHNKFPHLKNKVPQEFILLSNLSEPPVYNVDISNASAAATEALKTWHQPPRA